MEKGKPIVWIDTDTGVDDALALLCAAQLDSQGEITLAGVSAACGNVEQERTFENARNVLALAGREDIPVFPGAVTPLARPLVTAKHVHGEDGIGGAYVPLSGAKREEMPAWDALYECAKRCGGELELILVGPETNAAIAFEKHPDLKKYIRRILIMGGAIKGGNSTPYAEFNIYADPEAAAQVFALKLPVLMFGLDVTMKAVLTREDITRIEAGEGAGSRFFRESTAVAQGFYRRGVGDIYCCHDVCPVLYLTDPGLFTGKTYAIDVITRGERLGQTAGSACKPDLPGAVTVFDGVDRELFAGRIKTLLAKI